MSECEEARREEEERIQNSKRKPHTSMWGNIVCFLKILVLFQKILVFSQTNDVYSEKNLDFI